MKAAILIAVNLALVGIFVWLMRRPGRLSYYQNGNDPWPLVLLIFCLELMW